MCLSSRPSRRKPQRGVTLVELMIALVIGVLMTLGTVQLFMNGTQALTQTQRQAERQEVLNILFELLSRDIQVADGRVTPVMDGQAVTRSGYLLAEFNGQGGTYDPFCADDRLEGVEYFKAQDKDDVMVRAQCRDPRGTVYNQAAQPVISHVASLEFERKDDWEGVIAIEVKASMNLPDSTEDHSASFLVVNRNSVMTRLE
ncbi:prepilin-type N-terminal cleavage/methylation domain-containing protein [Aidingimonas halophila]|uniref:Prepilin-type N-terminal cleavage/methylation domain-containing protein n=2 Tax=Aidingimonas halophila TaxID=574349 RepID=A0A1H3HJ86_9GAMM|nr:prepilin-type N-terminal cleavage/methylation domain-containing protein [Aidingimonas halophila]GHC37011.1 hypothetical protein GCM10008094_32830 [Aidingimonas halophila]SDY14854.1 prepilin-type N-terminal cleavage/methylation domain-containing protein [Aidingimonas halophila]